jgi:quercetin dioxygenase-like cupin family protein
MKTSIIIAGVIAATLASAALAQQPAPVGPAGVVRAGSATAQAGSPSNFTGQVSVRILATPEAPGRTSVGLVTFQPGARSFWHTHPAGQALVVTEGCGWIQRESGPVVRICKGDTVSIPAGARHWHGATANTAMSHLAITETVEGRNADWMEPVSAAQYTGPGR